MNTDDLERAVSGYLWRQDRVTPHATAGTPTSPLPPCCPSMRAADLPTLLRNLKQIFPMLDAVPTTVFFIKDLQARYVAANLTLVQRCGLKSPVQLIGKTSFEVFSPEMGSLYIDQDRQVLDKGTTIRNQLELHPYVNREPGWCLTHKSPLYSESREIIGMIGVSCDLQATSEAHQAYRRIVAVDRHIRDNFNKDICVADLTTIAGLSIAQLERYCKRIFHLTPRQMIMKRRLEHAHGLLVTTMPITGVALECGYTDHSAFSRQFKTLTGLTPQQYRKATRIEL